MAEISWQAELKGLMYRYDIRNTDIADRLGLGKEYVASVFTGKRTPPDAEERFRAAVDAIIEERSIANAEG